MDLIAAMRTGAERIQIRRTREAKIPTALSVVLLVALGFSSPSQAAPAEQQVPNATIEYWLATQPGDDDLTLCTGEKHAIYIFAIRSITAVGSPHPVGSPVEGRVSAASDDPLVAEVRMGLGGETSPLYGHVFATILAGEPGETTVRFNLIPKVDPITGIMMRADELEVNVEVVPCYEAYAGTLMRTFTKKAVCTMRENFTVAGFGGPFSSVTAVFAPNPLASIQARVTLAGGDYIATGRVAGVGRESSHGQWEAIIGGGSNSLAQIHLNGIGILVYDIGITVSDPHPTESVYVLELRLASPHLCPGT